MVTVVVKIYINIHNYSEVSYECLTSHCYQQENGLILIVNQQ